MTHDEGRGERAVVGRVLVVEVSDSGAVHDHDGQYLITCDEVLQRVAGDLVEATGVRGVVLRDGGGLAECRDEHVVHARAHDLGGGGADPHAAVLGAPREGTVASHGSDEPEHVESLGLAQGIANGVCQLRNDGFELCLRDGMLLG